MKQLVENLNKINFNLDDFIIVCIGTQRAYLDSVGPVVGTKLQELYPNAVIIGQLNDNCHALSLESKLQFINKKYPDKKILAIDACCTKNPDKIGTIEFKNESISPGAGVGKKLPSVGDYCIKAYTVFKNMEYLLDDSILAFHSNNKMFYNYVNNAITDIVCGINYVIANNHNQEKICI